MKKGILILVLLWPLFLSAQVDTDPAMLLSDSSIRNAKQEAFLSAEYGYSSNALTNSLYNVYIAGGFINDATKNTALRYLKSNNVFGGDYIFSATDIIGYGLKDSSRSQHFYVRVKNVNALGSQFSGDMYNLVFYGNAGFAGQNANFSNFAYRSMAYNEIEIGVAKSKSKGKNRYWYYGYGVGLVQGLSTTKINIPQGNLFTSETGDSVALQGSGSEKTIPQSTLLATNGLGAALNGFVAYQFNAKSSLMLSVQNLGVIFWSKKNLTQVNFDTSVNYKGAAVNVVTGNFNTSNYQPLFDTLAKRIIPQAAAKGFTSYLPMNINLVYRQIFSRCFSGEADATYSPYLFPLPGGRILGTVKLFNWLDARVGVLGSQAGFGIYTALALHHYDKWGLLLGTNHLEAYISPANTTSQGLFATFFLNFTKSKHNTQRG